MNKTLEMDKVIKCLALELPEPVWNDVNKKWQEFKATLQQSHAVSGDVDGLAHSAADKWVFEINGNKWSNNDSAAGDNFGSYKSGFKSGYAAAQQAGDGWISVNERLPADNEDYEVWVKGNIIPIIAHYLSKKYFSDNYDDENYMEEGWYYSHAYNFHSPEFTLDVTHWRPLPQPPSNP